MPNEFTKIFNEKRNEYSKNIVEDICSELGGEEGFSQLNQRTQENLPAFAAWIAEEMKITPTQLRRFYTYVKSIERNARNTKPDREKLDSKTKAEPDREKLDSKTKAKLMFLLPKLAGSITKKEQDGIKVLHKVFSTCIQKNKIQTKDDLESFVEFFEAILDYHATFERKREND